LKKNEGSGQLIWTSEKTEVSESGELGYTWGFYKFIATDSEGKIHTSKGKHLGIWKKQPAGGWKIAIDTGNKSPD